MKNKGKVIGVIALSTAMLFTNVKAADISGITEGQVNVDLNWSQDFGRTDLLLMMKYLNGDDSALNLDKTREDTGVFIKYYSNDGKEYYGTYLAETGKSIKLKTDFSELEKMGNYTKLTQDMKSLVGWTKTKSGTKVDYKVGESITVTNEQAKNSIVLYAVYKTNKRTITFDVNGGTFKDKDKKEIKSPISGEFAESKKISSVLGGKSVSTISRSRYNFLGWATDKNATEAEYNNDSLINLVNNGSTLYAVWQKRGEATGERNIIFNANGGKFTDSNKKTIEERSVLVKESAKLKDCYKDYTISKDEYNFIGWTAKKYVDYDEYCKDNDAVTMLKVDEIAQNVTDESTLYALWQKKGNLENALIVNCDKKVLLVGETYQYRANKSNSDVVWSTTNANVATVDENGVVTAKKCGNFTLKCANKYNSKEYTTFIIYVDEISLKMYRDKSTKPTDLTTFYIDQEAAYEVYSKNKANKKTAFEKYELKVEDGNILTLTDEKDSTGKYKKMELKNLGETRIILLNKETGVEIESVDVKVVENKKISINKQETYYGDATGPIVITSENVKLELGKNEKAVTDLLTIKLDESQKKITLTPKAAAAKLKSSKTVEVKYKWVSNRDEKIINNASYKITLKSIK